MNLFHILQIEEFTINKVSPQLQTFQGLRTVQKTKTKLFDLACETLSDLVPADLAIHTCVYSSPLHLSTTITKFMSQCCQSAHILLCMHSDVLHIRSLSYAVCFSQNTFLTFILHLVMSTYSLGSTQAAPSSGSLLGVPLPWFTLGSVPSFPLP